MLSLRLGGRSIEITADTEPRQVAGPEVTAGEEIELVFADDAMDDQGNDRNVWVGGLQVVPAGR